MPIDQVDVDAPEAEMSFWEHLEELRWHVIRILIVLTITSSVAFLYPEIVYDKIILGPKSPDFITYKLLCQFSQKFNLDDSFCHMHLDFDIVSRELGEQLSNQFWISFCMGLIITFPYFIWEVWRFVSPALKQRSAEFIRCIYGLNRGSGADFLRVFLHAVPDFCYAVWQVGQKAFASPASPAMTV